MASTEIASSLDTILLRTRVTGVLLSGLGQNPGTTLHDCDGPLEMRGRAAIGSNDRPSIPFHAHIRASAIHHGFDRDDCTRNQARPLARIVEVGNPGLRVQARADPVPSVLPNHGVAVALGMGLHCTPDVRNAVSRTGSRDSRVESPVRDLEQMSDLFVDPADGNGCGVVAVVTVHDATEVQAHDVAFPQFPPPRGDPMDDFVVDGNTQGSRESVVPLEGRNHAVALEVVGGDPVEVRRRAHPVLPYGRANPGSPP